MPLAVLIRLELRHSSLSAEGSSPAARWSIAVTTATTGLARSTLRLTPTTSSSAAPPLPPPKTSIANTVYQYVVWSGSQVFRLISHQCHRNRSRSVDSEPVIVYNSETRTLAYNLEKHHQVMFHEYYPPSLPQIFHCESTLALSL